MNRKVCIYSRISTNDGKQDTKGQVGVLLDFVKSHGFKKEEIEIYEEELSGYLSPKDRPKLNYISSIIKSDPKYYSKVYVTELSRLGRTPKEVKNLVEEWTDLGVNIHIMNKNLQTIKDGERDMMTHILIAMLVEFYNFEVQTFKERSKYGLLKSVRNGKMGGGIFHLYGYKKDGLGQMVIDEFESPIVKRIFQLYLDGNGVKIISNILNKSNIPTKTKRSFPDKVLNKTTGRRGRDISWTDGQIYSILTNTAYKGQRKFLGQTVPCPEIIDEQTFDWCQNRLAERNSKGNSVYIYLLKGKIICGNCRRNYVGRFKPQIKGDKVYKCSSTRIGNHTCSNKGVNIKQLESILYHFSFHIMDVVNYINLSGETRTNISSNITLLENELENTKSEIEKLDSKQKKLLEIFLDGKLDKAEYYKMTETFDKKNEQKKKKLKSIKREILIKNKELNSSTKTEFLNSKESRTSLQEYFHKVFHKVVIHHHNNDWYIATVEIRLLNDNKFIFELLIDKTQIRRKQKQYFYMIKSGTLLYENEQIMFSEQNIKDLPEFVPRNIVTFDKKDIENYQIKNETIANEQLSVLSHIEFHNNFLFYHQHDDLKKEFFNLLNNTLWNPVWYMVIEDFQIDMKDALAEDTVESVT